MVDRFSPKQVFLSPLARRMTISIILLSSIITLFLTAIQLYWTYRTDLSDIKSELNRIEQVHLRAISQSLWAANTKELNLQLEGLVQTPYIAYAVIRESQKVWSEAGTNLVGNRVIRHYPLTYEYRGEVRNIGFLDITADLSLVYEHLLTEASIVLVSNAFKTFLVAAFMLLFFHRQVNRFLTEITKFFHVTDIYNVRNALVLPRQPLRVPDEFDELVDVINSMVQKNRQAHSELNDAKERFHAIANYTVDWECWFDIDSKLRWVNPSVTRLTGYTPDECYAMNDFPLPLVADEHTRRTLRNELQQAASGTIAENLEFQIRHKDGHTAWMAMSWQPLFDVAGAAKGFRTSIRDVSRLKQVELELYEKVYQLQQAESSKGQLLNIAQQEKARMSSLLAAMNIGILFEDIDNKVVYFNPSFRRIWLIPETVDLKDKKTTDVLAHSANVLARPDHFSKHILHTPGTHEVSEPFELETADGRAVTQLSYPVHDQDERFVGRLWLYEDVTRERKTAEQLIYLAERDSLTGLYNRYRFQEELTRMLADVKRRKSHGALLFFDLDEFKYINDNFGHRAGDAMLVRVAGEVSSLIRRNEVIARIGGDEFAILMPEANKEQAIHLAERVVRAAGITPFQYDGQKLRLTTSLGIALYPEHGDNAEELVSHADAAMYQAKDAGKNAWRVYSHELDSSEEMLHRLTWGDRLAGALENNLFRLHFQGIYSTQTGKLCHMEALVRMQDIANPDELIMPSHFISIAEQNGKIREIDHWVVTEVIRLLAAHPELPAIAVNVSGRSFGDLEFLQYIGSAIARAGISPARLMVELTETSAVSDLHDAQHFIESLHQTGCKICLDDFGTGFSSFAYLKYLKADVLKIDGLFIRDLPHDQDNQVFVKSIVDVARGMNKLTIAEFVEDSKTLDMLIEFGVDMVQGYHLDMPQAEYGTLLENAKVRFEKRMIL